MNRVRKLVMLLFLCLCCLVFIKPANAENWIEKDSYCSTSLTISWDADSVYSDDGGNIINFKMKMYNTENNTLSIFSSQIHQKEILKFTYGMVYDTEGNLLESGPMASVLPIPYMNNKVMYDEIISYYYRYCR